MGWDINYPITFLAPISTILQRWLLVEISGKRSLAFSLFAYKQFTLRQCEYVEHTRSLSSREDRKVFLIDPPAHSPHAHDINKKITLLKYFKNYLTEQSSKVLL